MGMLTARDWLDPRRLYDPRVPSGRLMFIWGGYLFPLISITVLGLALVFLETMLGYYSSSPLLDIFEPFAYLGSILLFVLVAIRRLKDLDKSGWYLLLGLVPFINLVLIVWMIFAPSVQQAVAPSVTPSRIPSPSPDKSPGSKFCSSCGGELSGRPQFCEHCGAMIQPSTWA